MHIALERAIAMGVMELIVIGMWRVVAEHRSIPAQDRRVGISRGLHARFLAEDKAFAEELLHDRRVYLQIRAESVWAVLTAAHLSRDWFVSVPSLEEKKPLRNIGRFGLLPRTKPLMQLV